MDCFSSKIEIRFIIDIDKNIDKNLISANNRKLLADIEGSLSIYIDGIVFFKEEYILLLEFATTLSNWLNQIEKGVYQDFVYETMDYSEGSLIEFNKKSDDVWEISSIWGNKDIIMSLCIEDIIIAVNRFLTDFRKELYTNFSISLEKFVN